MGEHIENDGLENRDLPASRRCRGPEAPGSTETSEFNFQELVRFSRENMLLSAVNVRLSVR